MRWTPFAVLVGMLLGCPPLDLPAQGGPPAMEEVRAAGGRAGLLAEGERWLEQDDLRAVPYFLAATRDRQGRPVIDSLAGRALHRAATAYYNQANDSLAAHYYRRAIALRDSLYPFPHEDRALSRSNLSHSLGYLGKLDSAVIAIREAHAIYDRLPRFDSIDYLRSLNQLAVLAKDLRDFRIAYSSSMRATGLVEQIGQVEPYDRFITYYNAALTLLRMDELDPALDFARRTVDLAPALENPIFIPIAHNLLAIVQRELGLVREGYQNLKKAERMITPDTRNDPTYGDVYLNLAEYYGGENDVENFEIYRERARRVFETIGLRDYYTSEKIPEILLRWRRYEEALQVVNERLAFLTGGTGFDFADSLANLPAADIIPLIDLLSVRARTYTATGQGARALSDYDALFALQEHLRAAVNDAASRRYLSRNLRPYFDRAIALHLESYRAEGREESLWRAFALSEQSRAYSLLTALHASRETVSPEVRQLVTRISSLERRVAAGEAGTQADLEAARLRLDGLQRQLPRTTGSRQFDRDALIKHLAARNCTLLEYHLSPEGSLVFLLTPDGKLTAHPIAADSLLAPWSTAWREAIEASSYRRKSLRPSSEQDSLDRAFVTHGTRLAEALLPGRLREALHLRPRLCIVPDGVLHYLPFGGLPLAAAEPPLRYAELDYLQRHATLQYAYSGDYLLEVDQRRRRDYAYEVVAFAPSFADDRRLSPLVHNAEEVRTIATLVPATRAFFGAEARRDSFLSLAGKARVLHLSSHGSVNATDPNLSFVAFSGEGGTPEEDGLLYFNDLYALPVDNELTVLSACETAIGQLAIGETTMSFASAFAAAGARSTLTTLWAVDDAATRDLVTGFYRRLVGGQDRVTALHGAQEELRTTVAYGHPYYWAGLMLYGSGGTLPLDGEEATLMPWWGYLLSASLVVAILYYFLRVLRNATAYES
ncbi:CHAT domain-containing protein [Lewinella marina]|nr:CHAT domain-containing tetratricopeptide repeat protein [Neolewinella marina]NJB87411.1 CHAT domain-containing protein [Neolewinella marina]